MLSSLILLQSLHVNFRSGRVSTPSRLDVSCSVRITFSNNYLTVQYLLLHIFRTGETNPADSKPGTIRGDFAIHVSNFITSLIGLLK